MLQLTGLFRYILVSSVLLAVWISGALDLAVQYFWPHVYKALSQGQPWFGPVPIALLTVFCFVLWIAEYWSNRHIGVGIPESYKNALKGWD
jgi:hypothetical protein